MPHRVLPPLTWAAVLLLVPGTGAGRAATTGPQAAFTVEDGWVKVIVHKDEAPVGIAHIRVYNDAEQQISDGETDERGNGTLFPVSDSSCRIGVTINSKECDLIPLRIHGTRVEPSRVLLTFGTRPCCRALAALRRSANSSREGQVDEPEPARPREDWVAATAAAGGFFLLAAGVVLIVFRRGGRPPLSPSSPLPSVDSQGQP
jgi:hypothetical protein